ncbi:MAG: ribosome silencing factor [Coxiellaceae bacterium]|nr:ribosome silencing factor [Coxiellaceae bacterium]
MKIEDLTQLVTQTLEDNKASDIRVMDVTELTDVTDRIIICSAISGRHVDALRDKVVVAAKEAGEKPLGVDGQSESGWVLIDLQDVIVHIMLPETRDFYSLEKLWHMTEAARKTEAG